MYLITKNKEECTGCTACKNICPQKAIEMKEDNEGFLYPAINKEKCVNCKLCEKVCPYNKENCRNNVIESYGIKLKDLESRKSSSSGGAFVAISDYILDNGGIVYGAGFDDDFYVLHKRATNKQERDELKKSKYVQSDLKDIFEFVKFDLENNKKVLFTGTPCQVNGLKNYLNGYNCDNLYTCDLICHGVPSPKVYKDYLNYISKGKKISIFNFRDKKYGWGSHYETYQINNKNYAKMDYKNLFYANLILRPSCYTCRYANLNRVGDITIGDFWGIEKVNNEFKDKEGVSLFIINTNKGKKVFENIKNSFNFIKVNIKDALQHNLVEPTELPKNREEFWKDYNENNLKYIINKYVPKIYDKNVNKVEWFFYKVKQKIKSILIKS